MRREPQEARPTLAWLALAGVYIVWGSTYLAIRVAVHDLPPAILAGSRYLLAGLMLYPIAVRSGSGQLRVTDRPQRLQWLTCAVVGVLLLVMGNGGVTFAERTVPSGLTAVLVATVPLWMVVFGVLIDHNQVTAAAGLGLGIGLAGVAILAGGGPLRGHWVGVCIVLAASASWGLGSVIGQHMRLPRRALLAAAMQMLFAGAVLLTLAALSGEFGEVQWSTVRAESWLALLWLIVPGSILAFTAYGYSLAHLPITTVSTYAYVNPVVAVALGTALLGETFALREALGTALVVLSVVLTMHRALPKVEGSAEEDQPDQRVVRYTRTAPGSPTREVPVRSGVTGQSRRAGDQPGGNAAARTLEGPAEPRSL